MRTYKSGNQNTNAVTSGTSGKDVEESEVSKNVSLNSKNGDTDRRAVEESFSDESLLPRDKKIEAFMGMVNVALEKKKSDNVKNEESSSSAEVKINPTNTKRVETSVKDTDTQIKVKKKFPIVAVIISLLIGGAVGYLISNSIAKNKLAEVNGDKTVISEYRSKIDELYSNGDKTDVLDSVSMDDLTSIGSGLNTDSKKLGSNIDIVKSELVDIASYIGYRDELKEYRSGSKSLMTDDFISFYNKAYKEASGYKTDSLRESVLGILNRLFSLRESYLIIESDILRFGSLMDVDVAKINSSINDVTNGLDKGYLSSLLNYIKANQNCTKAEINLKSATDKNKSSLQKALDEAKTVLNEAKENLDGAITAQSGNINDSVKHKKEGNNNSEVSNEVNEESSKSVTSEVSKSN